MNYGLSVYFTGLFDSLRLQYPLHLLWESSTAKVILGKSFAFNFAIFLYNVYYTYYVPVWYNSYWQWFYPVFFVVWVLPSFSAAIFLNSQWSGELSELVCKKKYGAPKHQYGYIEAMYGTFLIYIFHSLLAIVGWSVSFAPLRLIVLFSGYSWLSAFYLFETRLIYKGFVLPQRIQFLQRRWLYFLGYGTPLALMHMLLPYNTFYTLHYLISNLMVLNTIHLTPQKYTTLESLPIFGIVLTFTTWLTKKLSLKKK